MSTVPKRRSTEAAGAGADDPRSRLHACIKGLTRSGRPSLDEAAMCQLRQLCRADEQLVDLAHALLCHRLGESHAQVRYSAFQIVDQLFRRSGRFRCLTLDRFERLVDCVLIDNEASTPPPKPVSVFRQLGDLALEVFINWHEKFSEEHPKLVFAFRYLSEAHSARLRQVRDRLTQAETARVSAARQLAERKRELLADTGRALTDDAPELSACLATVANCLALLVPSPAEFDVNPLTSACGAIADVSELSYLADDDLEGVAAAEPLTEDEQRRLHGIVGPTSGRGGGGVGLVAIRLCQPCLRETPDNAELIEALVTRAGQLRRRMRPRLARWLAVVERCADADSAAAEGLRPRLTDLLAEADRLLGQLRQLRIQRATAEDAAAAAPLADSEDEEAYSDSSTGDFEAVAEKEGFEAEPAAPASTSKKPPLIESLSKAPSEHSTLSKASAASTSEANVSKASTSGVPVVPFGVDLLSWGAAGFATIGYRPDNGGHALGYRPPDGDGEFEISGTRDMLSMRTILFTGGTGPEPPPRACRYPLPSGGLCRRMDRVRCPFHGRIVPRDEAGRPTEPGDAPAEASTAADLQQPKEMRKKKRKKNGKLGEGGGGGGLVDIREDTPRRRLAARVASKAALRRAAEDEAARQRRKTQEKFGDHFQYQFLN